jgi:hypothetical protein
MLPRRYIEEWKEFAPWPEDAQVEQDLIIEKAMLELFSDPFLQEPQSDHHQGGKEVAEQNIGSHQNRNSL